MIGLQQTKHHFHSGGFSGPVLPNEAEDASLRHCQVQIVYDFLLTEAFRQVLYRKHVHSLSPFPKAK